MIAICLTLALAFAWTSTVASQGPERVRYRLDVTFTDGPPAVSGRAAISIPRAVLPRPTEVRLGLGLGSNRRIEVSAVGDSAGRTGTFTLSADSTVLVMPVEDGSGPAVVLLDFTAPLDPTARDEFGYHLASATEDVEAWYPAVLGLPDSLARFRDFDAHIEVPGGYGLLATGQLIDSVRSPQGTLYRYHAEEVEGVALAVGAGYRVETVARGGTRVRAFASAGDGARFRRIAAATAEAAEWYRATYGFFPASEVGVLPGYRTARGGFPLPQLFMIHQGDLSDPFVRWITAHELAHYYWGLWVLDADERLGWLALGLGIWTDQLYLARTADRSLPDQWRRVDGDNSFEDFARAQLANYDQRLGLADSLVAAFGYDYNSLVRHGKGATGVFLVAQQLGTDRFVALQRELLERYRHRPLSAAEFARAAEAAGFSGAGALLGAWARGDARIDYALRGIRPDPSQPGKYWIRIDRTGTVSYPVTVEAVAGNRAARARITGDAAVDSVAVNLAAPPVEIRLDPEGEVPMRSSDHPDMRRVFLMAMGTEGPAADFLTLAEAHLARHPDPHLAARVIERLFELGRHQRVFDTAQRFPAAVTCLDRPRCFAALQVARSLARLGKLAGARAWLRNIEPAMAQYGVAGFRRLADAKREISPPT